MIKEFKLKDNIGIEDLLFCGFVYSLDCRYLSKIITLKGEIVLWIKYHLSSEEITINVYDMDLAILYLPFYRLDEQEEITEELTEIIEKYNTELSKLFIFDEITKDEPVPEDFIITNKEREVLKSALIAHMHQCEDFINDFKDDLQEQIEDKIVTMQRLYDRL